jgi:uncharacterized membrane protein
VDWGTLFLIAAGLGTAFFMYRSTKTTAAVATEHQVPIPEGGLEAIEYFWRPG